MLSRPVRSVTISLIVDYIGRVLCCLRSYWSRCYYIDIHNNDGNHLKNLVLRVMSVISGTFGLVALMTVCFCVVVVLAYHPFRC